MNSDVDPHDVGGAAEGHRFEDPQNGLQTSRFLTHLATGWSHAPTKNACKMQAFPEAADGIRTHDLLHGKRRHDNSENAPDSSPEAKNEDG
jgi:hypothetical protein